MLDALIGGFIGGVLGVVAAFCALMWLIYRIIQ